MTQNNILLTNIQRFSLNDGPGIRTTVFLKGCSLQCPWCSNPENIRPALQPYAKDGVFGTYGKWYEPKELAKECLKDRTFYEGKVSLANWSIKSAEEIDIIPGGVTFSGGEALLQIEALMPVIAILHEAGVHVAVETCLFVQPHFLMLAIQNIDFFYVDVKILNPFLCSSVEHGNLAVFLNNFEALMGSEKPVVVRVPVIGGRTDGLENRKAVYTLLKQYKPLKIELIKEHNLGESKYKSLGMEMSFCGVTDELMYEYKNELEGIGVPVEICRI